MNISLTKNDLKVHGFTLSLTEPCLVETCVAKIEDKISEKQLFYFDILYWTWAAIIVLIGIPMNCLIVHYEWFGGDPQKRSLANRFVSSACIADMTCLVLLVALTGSIRYDSLKN